MKASPAGNIKPRIVVEPAEKWAAFRSARAALAASGTVTLELAISAVPTVAAYRLSLVEEFVVRLLGLGRRLSTVILANLVMGQNVVPEFLQRDCTAQRLADALVPLLADSPERARQLEAFGRIDSLMKVDIDPKRQGGGTCPRCRAGSRAMMSPCLRLNVNRMLRRVTNI